MSQVVERVLTRSAKAIAAAAAVGLALAACGGSSSSDGHGSSSSGGHGSSAGSTSVKAPPVPASVKIDVAKVGKLGPILVTGRGRALYIFQPDQASRVACDAACQSVWPPEIAPAGGIATGGKGVEQHLIGSRPDPATGGRIVTYDGWPLYTYSGDSIHGPAAGQGLDSSGGRWLAMSPTGNAIQ